MESEGFESGCVREVGPHVPETNGSQKDIGTGGHIEVGLTLDPSVLSHRGHPSRPPLLVKERDWLVGCV